MPSRGQAPRLCATCGRPYWRRNLLEMWTVRNEGHRAGWVKVTARQCLKCSTTSETRKLLMVARVPVTVAGVLRAVRKQSA